MRVASCISRVTALLLGLVGCFGCDEYISNADEAFQDEIVTLNIWAIK